MKTVRVYQLAHLSPVLFRRLKAAQTETAQVWNTCMDLHKQARLDQARWPEQGEMQQATRNRFALHSRLVHATFRTFLGTIETTRRCLGESAGQPRIVGTVSSETGHTGDAAEKPVRL
jgi:hypothetical protein